MIKIAKKASLLGLILSISWLGVTVGQGLTQQIFNVTAQAQAATTLLTRHLRLRLRNESSG